MLVTIKLVDAEIVRDNIADLLCWWQGFRMGLKKNGEENQNIVAENGIKELENIHALIKDSISIEIMHSKNAQ